MKFTVSPQSSNAKTSFEEGSELMDKLGLRVQLFGKDLDKLFKNMECTIFLVVTRLYGDELYHPVIVDGGIQSGITTYGSNGSSRFRQPKSLSKIAVHACRAVKGWGHANRGLHSHYCCMLNEL